MQKPKEKPWTIKSWEDFRKALETMNPRTKLYKLIQAELVKRGNWKLAPRGPWDRAG